MKELVLETKNLTKKYGNLTAVDNLSIKVEKGWVFGILGPNGSGKTSTLGMLLGVLGVDEGSFSWCGLPQQDHNIRRRIGSLLEQPNFYPYLSAIDNLRIIAEIKGISSDTIEPALREVNLYERRRSKFKTYSYGMKQRLALASVLIAEPDVLVLDEPTNGLDPQGIAEVRELIIKISQRGTTIILASHILDEVEKVCSHVAVLKRGNLVTAGSVSEILGSEDIFELGASNTESLVYTLALNPQVKNVEQKNGKVYIQTEGVTGDQVNEYLFKNGITLNHLQYKKKTLEEQFLELTRE